MLGQSRGGRGGGPGRHRRGGRSFPRPRARGSRGARLGLRLAAVVVGASALPVLALRWVPPPFTAFMVGHAVREGPGEIEYRWVPWREISPWAGLAVVAAEDQKFPNHHGFDLTSIGDAWADRERSGRLRGASTISQQVAKNLFLWPGRSWLRKGIEAWLTLWIEALWPKRRILEVYLNVAEFGDGVFGVGAASRRFFGKPPARLGGEEAALLAAVLPDPERRRVDEPSAHVRSRASAIVRQMHALGGVGYLGRLEEKRPRGG
jgi:monofunctional biosynthetic peptidoglycan transglycosylase